MARGLEEDGTRLTSRQLLHAARLLRGADALRKELGEVDHRVEPTNALWAVYQMIGKLEPRPIPRRMRSIVSHARDTVAP